MGIFNNEIVNSMTGVVRQHQFVLKLLASFLLLAYCFNLMDFDELRQIDVRWRWFFLAWVLVLLDQVIGAYRFKVLMDPVHPLAASTHIKYYFWAGFFNSALPGSIGGDAMRIFWLKRDSISAGRAALLVIIERGIGVFTLILIAAIAAINVHLPASFTKIATALGIGLSVIFLVGAGSFLLLKRVQLKPVIASIVENFRVIASAAKMAKLLSLSLLYQVLTVTITICVGISLGIDIELGIWFFIVPLVWLITFAPISLGGLGVRELSLVYLLGAYGQPGEQAVVLGLMTFLVHLAGGLPGGVWYVYAGRHKSDR